MREALHPLTRLLLLFLFLLLVVAGRAMRTRQPGALCILGETSQGALSCTPDHMGPLSQAHRFALGLPMDINLANQEELMLLPGIGQVRAQEIVRRRRTNPFCRLGALKGLKGLRTKDLRRLKPLLSFSCTKP